MEFAQGFLHDMIRQFENCKSLAEKSFDQLTDADFHFQPSPESNSIAIIIQHMSGNMLSRWTNFLTEDGEKGWRKRDAEFEASEASRTALMSLWNEGWICVFNALNELQP